MRIASVLAVVALALSGTTAAAASTSQATDVVVSGTVAQSGSSVTGATVQLYAWPQQPDTLQDGQAASIVLEGSATTDSTGSYSIDVPQSSLTPYADSNGIVNMMADAGAGLLFFSVQLTPGDPMINESIPGVPDGRCGTPVKYKDLGKQWGVVGETAEPSAYVANQGFRYSVGQSSDLGVADSTTAWNVGFSADGTQSKSSSSSIDFGWHEGHKNLRYKTEWVYWEYKSVCASIRGTTTYWIAKPHEFAGGSKLATNVGTPRERYCTSYSAGTGFSSDRASAETFGAGVSIPAIGIGVSAHTGYDSDGTVLFNFLHNGSLCGNNDYPPEAALVTAKS